ATGQGRLAVAHRAPSLLHEAKRPLPDALRLRAVLHLERLLPLPGQGPPGTRLALQGACKLASETARRQGTLSLEVRGRGGATPRILAIASGGEESVSGMASARCEIRIDDEPAPAGANPGELTDNSSGVATNGFARTVVSTDRLPRGRHQVALACNQLSGNV